MTDDLTHRAREYLRCLNGETIPMNFNDASLAIVELVEAELARSNGHLIVMTAEGRVMAKQLKRDAHGRME